MIVKGLLDEDFINYKVPSMIIEFPYCSFKCDKEYGEQICQNCKLAQMKNYDIPIENIVKRYKQNDISEALVCAGLEPMDSFDDLLSLIKAFREVTNDEIIIYTGFYKDEIEDKINILKDTTNNIIVKFGRFIPHQSKHFDEVLGVELASDNQYAERIC